MGGGGRARAGVKHSTLHPKVAPGSFQEAPQSTLSQSVLRGIVILGKLIGDEGCSGQITWGNLEFC